MLTIAAIAVSIIAVSSCGHDDAEEDIFNKENPMDDGGGTNPSLSAEAQKFIGLWNVGVGNNSHYFIFLPNGRAMRDSQVTGKWTYSPDNKVLITTIDMWSFSILATLEDSWVGTSLNTERAASASKRSDLDYVAEYLKMLSWKNDNGFDPTVFVSYETDSKGGCSRSIEYSDETLSDKKMSVNFNYYVKRWSSGHFGSSNEWQFSGSIVIEKPYSDHPKMIITSDVQDVSPWAPGTYEGIWK